MTSQQISKLFNALETAEIKDYRLTGDEYVHIYNGCGGAGVIVNDSGSEMVYGIKRKSKAVGADPFNGNVVVYSIAYENICEAAVGGTYEECIKFFDALGVTLTKEQKKAMLEIDKTNFKVMPETGNYHPFKELTPEEYEALTPEEKAAYDKAFEEEKKRKAGITQGFAVRVQV